MSLFVVQGNLAPILVPETETFMADTNVVSRWSRWHLLSDPKEVKGCGPQLVIL